MLKFFEALKHFRRNHEYVQNMKNLVEPKYYLLLVEYKEPKEGELYGNEESISLMDVNQRPLDGLVLIDCSPIIGIPVYCLPELEETVQRSKNSRYDVFRANVDRNLIRFSLEYFGILKPKKPKKSKKSEATIGRMVRRFKGGDGNEKK